MTIVVDDPLIARMAIRRPLPLHESSRRLRELYPECPRVYGVAVMSDLSRRRWWPLSEALTTDRLQTMFDAAAAEVRILGQCAQRRVDDADPVDGALRVHVHPQVLQAGVPGPALQDQQRNHATDHDVGQRGGQLL